MLFLIVGDALRVVLTSHEYVSGKEQNAAVEMSKTQILYFDYIYLYIYIYICVYTYIYVYIESYLYL